MTTVEVLLNVLQVQPVFGRQQFMPCPNINLRGPFVVQAFSAKPELLVPANPPVLDGVNDLTGGQ